MIPASRYHDEQGIRFNVSFAPQLPPLKAGEKRRANAKAQPIPGAFYAHEDSDFAEILDMAFEAAKQDTSTMGFKIVGGNLRTERFKALWTISRTNNKNMSLTNAKEFYDMIAQAEQHAKHEVKLDIEELPVCLPL